jgi:hypothetical protein
MSPQPWGQSGCCDVWWGSFAIVFPVCRFGFGDGGFAHPAVLEFLDAQPKLEYVVAMAKNAVLKRAAAPGIRRARQLSRSSGKTEHIYGEVRYAARKWPCLRRVVIKAEVVRAPGRDPKDNPILVRWCRRFPSVGSVRLDRPGHDGYCHLTLADIDTGAAFQKLFHTNSCSAERRSQRNIK